MNKQSSYFMFIYCLAIWYYAEVSCTNGICFPYIGCFPQLYPWVSPTRLIPNPENPLKINITITFYCRKYQEGQTFQIYPNIDFNIKGYSPNKRTVTITHGFASSSRVRWVLSLTDAYLARMDANIFVVDWGDGAIGVTYDQAVGNIRVVGSVLGRFGVYLVHETGNKLRNFHMIGHSLGAHTAGYAAQVMNKNATDNKKVFRITGVDPAQPEFQNFPETVRLDKDRAQFVDIIHSNAILFIGVGYATDLGHVDFYLNNGYDQPNCEDRDYVKKLYLKINNALNTTELSVVMTVTCSHERALHVLVSSLDPRVKCQFIGHRIITRYPIMSDQLSCGEDNEDCIKMGIDTQIYSQRGAFQVLTTGLYPYCCNDYSIFEGCKP